MDHAAQLPLPAFCWPGDECPLRRLERFPRHPCWVVASAGVVLLEEVVAEPPATTRRASRTASGRNLSAAAASERSGSGEILLRAAAGGALPPWDVHTVLRYGGVYYRNVDTGATAAPPHTHTHAIPPTPTTPSTCHLPPAPVPLARTAFGPLPSSRTPPMLAPNPYLPLYPL